MKFDNAGDYATLYFTGKPGKLSFTIKLNGTANANNTFTVSTSSNGSDFSVLKTYKGTTDIPTSNKTYTIEESEFPNGTQYIRWTYVTKGSGNVGLGKIKLEAGTASGEATTLTIDASGITNTDVAAGTTAGTLVATVKDDSNEAIEGAVVTWNSSNEAVATIGTSTGVVTLVGKGSTTITANYAGVEDEYQPSSNTYTLTVINSDENDGSLERPYTATEAYDIINAFTSSSATTEKYYVTGKIVSFYNTNGVYSDNYKRYYISEDGTTTKQILVYNGKNLGNNAFTSNDDLAVGDNVVIYGPFQKYNGAVEISAGNYIYSLNGKKAAGLAYATASYNTHPNATFATPELTNPNNLTVSYASNNTEVAEVNATTGAVTIKEEGTAKITATFAGNDSFAADEVSYTITVARQAAGLSYSPTSRTITIDDTFTAPTFSNPNNLAVTYASDNTDVATVAADGTITCKNVAGTATITATSAQNDEYKAGSATFTLTVNKKVNILTLTKVNYENVDVTTELDIADLYSATDVTGGVTVTSDHPEIVAVVGDKLKTLSLGKAVITISIAESDTYKSVSDNVNVWVTCNTPAATYEGNGIGNGYSLVTDASTLSAGDKIIFVNTTTNGTGYAMSTTQNGNNRGTASVTVSDKAISSIGSSVQEITLEGDADGWYFNTGAGYLYAASNGSNHLKTQATKNDNAKATIEIAESGSAATVVFQGEYTHNEVRFNGTLVSCYLSTSDMAKPYIYRLNEATEFDISITDAGWRTLISSKDVSLPEGVKAYIVTENDETSAKLTEVSSVKANTPYLLQGAEGDHTLTIIDSADEPVGNLLQISTNTTGNGVYVLADDEDGIGFYKYNRGSLGAGRVYLPAPSSGSGARFMAFSFDDESTGISASLMNSERVNGEVYNLNGQRVMNPVKGLYIVNGRKVVVK